MSLTIRPARADERSVLEGIQREASLAREHDRDVLLAHPEAIAVSSALISDGCILVTEWNGVLKGFSVTLARDDGNAALDGLFVAPDAWGRGIGSHLLGQVEQRASATGARRLYVTSNLGAESFYRACGFEAVGDVQTEFGMARTMTKPLS